MAKRNAVSFNTIRRFMDSKGVEPLTSRMRTERSPMRTLKKPPKDKTFLWENGKKYRRNAGFWTSIAFEKKLPFLLQCKKVTLQEGCASDAIWTGDHLNTSCGSRTVWGWFGLYPLYNKIDEKQLDFSGCFFFIAQIGKNSADGYAPSEDENAQKSYQISRCSIQNIAIGIRTIKHIRYNVNLCTYLNWMTGGEFSKCLLFMLQKHLPTHEESRSF